MILQTPRLRLRPCNRQDVDALHSLWTNAEVRRYLWDNEEIDRATAATVVESAIESWHRHGAGLSVVLLQDAIIGFCGLRQFGEQEEWELLYGLLPAYWGRGYAVESARAVLSHAFRTLPCDRVASRTDPPNAASMRVMEKLGLRFDGVRFEDGRETVWYWSNRDEWSEQAGSPGSPPGRVSEAL